jgi:signal transduction histidine kinase
MTSSTFVAAPQARSALRDPVLLLPLIVAAGLYVGWLGVDAGVSGTRIAVDVALAWSFVAASLFTLDRPRWRRSRALLVAAAFALLAADLRWAPSDALWTVGFLVGALWLALLVHFVLTFPDGRPWSSWALVAIALAYGVALAGQVIGMLVDPRPTRDTLTVAESQKLADGVDRAQAVLGVLLASVIVVLVIKRLSHLRGAARRAQAPLLAAAVVCVPIGIVWLAYGAAAGGEAATVETVARAVCLLIPVGLVAGNAWSRLQRSDASDLVVELKTAGASSLGERLVRVLGDPTLEVAYRLDDGRFVDVSGKPFELPHDPNRTVTPLVAQDEEIAVLVHDPALLDEPELVESVRATAGLVLENERLAAQVRSQLAEVRASRGRIIAATDAERRRIERDLHDGVQQRLVTLSVSLSLEGSRADAATAEVLSRAQDELEEAIAELRELARGIHPMLLRDEGLDAAVDALVRRMPLPATVRGTTGGRLPEPVALAAYFVVAEGLTNVVKHASATEASVLLEREQGMFRVTVADDGVGGARIAADSGLAGLRDRLEALDAKLDIESQPGHGTTVRAEFLCES